MGKKLKYIVGILIIGVLLFFVFLRITKPKEEVEAKALPTVTTISMEKGNISVKEELLGEISANEQFVLLSKISGEVLEIYKENGEEVKKGEKIALLDNQKQIDAAKYSLEQARAQAQVASDSRDRLAALRESGDISVQDFETANAQIPVAQAELDTANERYEGAKREHDVAQAQLEAAQAEVARLNTAMEKARKQQEESQKAVGALAREMYQSGGVSSPLLIALSSSGTEEIADRAAAADAMTRAQDSALSQAMDMQAATRNQQSRQDAVTSRISSLEEKARKASEEAESAKNTAETKLRELDELKKTSEEKRAQWDAQKAQAEEQLGQWQREYQDATSKLAAIDEENRRQNRRYTSSSNFSSPLPVPLVVTSPFGWRVHPVLGISRYHNGTDFAANCGTEIYPVAEGVVTAVTVETAGGNVVYVNHGMMNGASMSTAYVHMQSTNVYVGQHVGRDTVLGWVGATGYATGCHLHLSVMRNGADVEPLDYL